MTGTQPRRAPVSIVCVFNDLDVRTTCLDASVDAGRAEAPQTEYLPVDNRDGRFTSAGAALNDGARRARHDVVVLVHQDVYLHSLVALEEAAAALLDDPGTGLLGAVGITSSDTVAGVVRDRVVMIGAPSSPSVPVDSLDEVLFLVERDRVLDQPLSEHPDLAWHAYAVEYGARVRSQGLRVRTHDVVLTHNSMTTNLDRLAEAHAHVARTYPDLLPLHTTCGVVRASAHRGRWSTAWRRRHGVATWARESFVAARLARSTGGSARDVVLGDIRLDVDDALDVVDADRLDVVNVVASRADAQPWRPVSVTRRGRDVSAVVATVDDLARTLAAPEPGRTLLVTGLDESALRVLAPALRALPHLVGHAQDTGSWVLVGATVGRVRALWPARRNAPFGLRPRHATSPGSSAGAPAELAR
ncbi:hypothetical protein [Cellulomonas sp. Leaf334]|uniref:hypothetical protein n=1 Tax=Cellulomonas sp. Leaf334 TaxID=1736339 RepID=UPI0006FDFEA9|nr:hypothetical protein [Cellulomonas sp. Leaf334]KQR12198.1 hypothetical protein ASF78_13685 [Cellulomonas sp. Leaf334]